MAFKADESFLDKITMGAVGTRAVWKYLEEDLGHHIIELERYSSSNKLWATKVKRLRVPDLMCVECGQRFECRAKSKLGIIMSDSPSKADRHWDYGLRSKDYVTFVACKPSGTGWQPSSQIHMYRVDELQTSVTVSRLGPPKSMAEGAERDREWPSKVPSYSGVVEDIFLDPGSTKVRIRKDNGQQHTQVVGPGYYLHVSVDDPVEAGSTIIASCVPRTPPMICDEERPDFVDQFLYSTDPVSRYAAAKALGFTPSSASIAVLEEFCARSGWTEWPLSDRLLYLEALGALAKLRHPEAPSWLLAVVTDSNNQELQMEGVLILAEVVEHRPDLGELLLKIAQTDACPSEVRAAATWYAGMHLEVERFASFFGLLADSDLDVRMHAVAGISDRVVRLLGTKLLSYFNDDSVAAASIASLIERNSRFLVPLLLEELADESYSENKVWWLLHVASQLPEPEFGSVISRLSDEKRRLLQFARTVQYENWLAHSDHARRYELLRRQKIVYDDDTAIPD